MAGWEAEDEEAEDQEADENEKETGTVDFRIGIMVQKLIPLMDFEGFSRVQDPGEKVQADEEAEQEEDEDKVTVKSEANIDKWSPGLD